MRTRANTSAHFDPQLFAMGGLILTASIWLLAAPLLPL
jgi:hypothetical protein